MSTRLGHPVGTSPGEQVPDPRHGAPGMPIPPGILRMGHDAAIVPHATIRSGRQGGMDGGESGSRGDVGGRFAGAGRAGWTPGVDDLPDGYRYGVTRYADLILRGVALTWIYRLWRNAN
jgi:hypothetical protein